MKTVLAMLPPALLLLASPAASADPVAAQLQAYAVTAKAADPAFSGFSAARGKLLHTQSFGLGKAATPACTSCHGDDPRGPGRTPSGKAIEPIARSVTPGRYNDPAKVEKWFGRNCRDVLGRACTALEKGDWLTFVSGR